MVKGRGGVKVVALAVAVAEAETGEEQDEEGEQLRACRHRMKRRQGRGRCGGDDGAVESRRGRRRGQKMKGGLKPEQEADDGWLDPREGGEWWW